jgi:hypothetical protein
MPRLYILRRHNVDKSAVADEPENKTAGLEY